MSGLTLSASEPRAPWQPPGVFASAWKLLRLRLMVSWNSFKRAKIGRKIGTIVILLLGLSFLIFIFWLSTAILGFFSSPDFSQLMGMNAAPFLRSIPAMIFTGGTLAILMTSFGIMLQALYLSGDMDFLMSAPIPVRSIFIAKLVEGILPSFLLYALFAVPLLFGMGAASGYHFLFYPLVIVLLAAFSLAGAALAALIVMALTRIFPARRMAEVLGFVIGLFFLILGQSSNFMRFQNIQPGQLAPLLTALERLNSPFSPMAWAADGAVRLGEGVWGAGLGLSALALVFCGAVFFGALTTAERLYYAGWSSMQGVVNSRKRKVDPARAAQAKRTGILASLVGQPVAAIMNKDWLLYRRDLKNLSRLVTPIILGIIYAVSMLQAKDAFPEGQGDMPGWFRLVLENGMLYSDVILALFIGWILTSSIAGMSFSMEGRNYWMLKMAPLSPRQLLTAKFLVSYLPSLVLCELYILGLNLVRGMVVENWLLGSVGVGAMLAGMCGIYLAFGTVGARFNWTNPNEMGKSVGCLGMLVGMIFIPLSFLVFVAPAFVFGMMGWPLLAGKLLGLVLCLAAGVAGVLVPLGAVHNRVPLLNED